MAKLISKTYGEALFELAIEEDKADVFMEEIAGIRQILAENQEFSRLMNHPKILKEEKIEVLETQSPEEKTFFKENGSLIIGVSYTAGLS